MRLREATTTPVDPRAPDSLTCRQGDVTVEAALVDAVACVVAAHDGRRRALARLAAQPHAAVALGTIGLVRTLIACERSGLEGRGPEGSESTAPPDGPSNLGLRPSTHSWLGP